MRYDNTASLNEVFVRSGDSPFISESKETLSQTEFNRLRRQSDRLEHLLKVMPAGVIVLDGNGMVRQANDQAKSLLGEPLEGQMWRSIIARSFKPKADDGHEVSLTDGRRVKFSITPLENEPGQLIVLTDLTETRALQARVSHMQRLSSLGKMVASLAHQIRTPLSAAILYASNLKQSRLADSARERFVDKLCRRLDELESQVNDMLLFAKSGDEQVVSAISLEQLKLSIEGGAEDILNQMNQQIVFDGFQQHVEITGNLTALQGALLNLIHNASQVSPPASIITIKAICVAQTLAILVCDQGPGIPSACLSKVFEPFYTTKSNGTGLGLAVVKSVATAHKGSVSAANMPDGGACFTLSLPITGRQVTEITLAGEVQ